MKKLLALLFVLVMTFAFSACGDTSSSDDSNASEDVAVEEEVETEAEANDPTADYSMEEENCYKAAMNYLDYTGFSKQGLIDQLSSEYGDNYPKETAEKVVNDIEEAGLVDWVEQAKICAQNYLDTMSFSKQELIDQLCSEYGDQFTREQAEEAVGEVYQ